MESNAPSPSPSSPPIAASPAAPQPFTPYQKVVVAILAFLQFTIILDFMIISPLGALLLRDLHIPTHKFGIVVSVYAFSAAISGILSAGFADRFDRKKMLMFFYVGFTLGTLLCGIAPNYPFLVMARVVTGLFGGVIGSIAMAIVADLFPFQMRGRVMGITQTAFGASQVLGLPLGMILATRWGWHAPFLLIVGLAAVAGVFIAVKLRPINDHLKLQRDRSAFAHLFHTVAKRRYLIAFVTTTMVAMGGFMLMPFGSTFTVNNAGISLEEIWKIYLATGICTLVAGPFLGRLSDRVGKYSFFIIGTIITMVMVVVYTHLGHTPMVLMMLVSSLMFIGITARMISASALMSAVPEPADRGAFMSVMASVQSAAGGVGAAVAGLIVVQKQSGALERYDLLGYVVCGAMLVVVVMMRSINRMVSAKAH
jgi:predicted MFS family arabinose efflux permease